MRVLLINSVCGHGSTGKICTDIYDLLVKEGHECCIAYGRNEAAKGYKTIKIGNKVDNYLHVAKTRLMDKHGFGSKKVTIKFIEDIKKYNPDIIHLHNIHGYYLNIEILFRYLKESNKKIVWTFHDCWPFTGHCAYYRAVACEKWKNHCMRCPLIKQYPKSVFDNSKANFELKKKCFTGLGDRLAIVTVSEWLKNEMKDSFFKDSNIITIQSGIDTDVFNNCASDFRQTNNLLNKRIILGVANVWDERKGLDDFLELSKMLDEQYQIVLVGLSDLQIKQLPSSILGIQRTRNARELAEIYSAADIYANFSKEETFGLTNYEAQACGTTTISFDAGGTPETLKNTNAYLIKNDVKAAYEFIINYDYTTPKAKINLDIFDKNKAFKKYIRLYEELL